MRTHHTDPAAGGRAATFWRENVWASEGMSQEVYPAGHVISLLCSCICFVRGSLFSFIHLFGNLDMEYRLQRSNLLIDEDVGGRTREDGAAGGLQR